MSLVTGVPVVEKKQFSMCTEPLMEKLNELKGRKQIVLCGIEAHVCVQQVGRHRNNNSICLFSVVYYQLWTGVGDEFVNDFLFLFLFRLDLLKSTRKGL